MIAYLFWVDSLFVLRRYTVCANAVILRKHIQYYCSEKAIYSAYATFSCTEDCGIFLLRNKLLDFFRVLFREIDIGVGMSGVGDGPE